MKEGDAQQVALESAFQSWLQAMNVQPPPDDYGLWFGAWLNGYNAGLFAARTAILAMGDVPVVVIAAIDRLYARKEND